MPASAKIWTYEYGGFLRTAPGISRLAHGDRDHDREYHFPDSANLQNSLTYQYNDDTTLSMHLILKAEAGTSSDNLNQGKWGEEAYLKLDSLYGEFFIGQMPNVATELGINRANLPNWQAAPEDIANYIHNPNWKQRNRTKYYSTLNSTLINTDGSSLKFSYLTPEFYNTTLGVSYVPHNRSADGLTSKFSPYYKDAAWVASAYHHQEFSAFDAEAYLSYADYEHSHCEYAGGLALYRKGWTVFGSYRQSHAGRSDYALAQQKISYNRQAGYDGFRDSKAWNIGLSYEFAIINTTVSYFDSRAENSRARSRIINWHNSIKPYKNLGFYLGSAWVDFETGNYNIDHGKRGLAFYAGAEISF